MVRLNKLLSALGVASRRAADTLITQGRVEVNGRVVTELGTKVDPDRDSIRVDGRRVQSMPDEALSAAVQAARRRQHALRSAAPADRDRI